MSFVTLTPSGGTAPVVSGSISQQTTYSGRGTAYQIAGLVPLIDCDKVECRYDQQCFFLPVFGNGETDPTYENDFNSWLVNFPSNTGNAPKSFNWSIEKAKNNWFDITDETEWEWESIANCNNNTYGTFFNLGDIPDHPTYTGLDINWGDVFTAFGIGIYRIKFSVMVIKKQIVFNGGVPISYPVEVEESCMASPPFFLQEWDCEKADGTVKFETSLTGSIGSIDEYYTVYNMCGFEWYDSIRFRGFFGYEKTKKYEELNLEHQNGQLDQIHNKLVNSFTLNTHYLPKWVHDRFKSYGLMADSILVSDYNYNNSDYDIKRKGVKLSGGYEPEYLDSHKFQPSKRDMQRTSKAKVEFRESVESVIKSLCCPC